MAKKIIGVENLNVIRDFVLSKILTESDDIRRTLTEENAEYLHNKLLEASESLKTDYESKYELLNNRIDTLKSEGVNSEELHELFLEIDKLNNNYVDMQNGLSAIEDSIIDIESSVMSPGQLNELIDTALIERTTITEDMVSAPNVYTQNLVALIAKFGTVRALNIVGDEIEGKTISAYDKIEGTDEPTWKLDRQGNGYLANKNISWDKDGNVTFGENVKIGWNDEWDEKIPTPDNDGLSDSDVLNIVTTTITKDYIESKNIQANGLKGNRIMGKTFESTEYDELRENTPIDFFDENDVYSGTGYSDPGMTGPRWQLSSKGQGYLANGNIRWDEDGNVEFGPDVTLSWGAIKDAVEENVNIPEGGGNGVSESDVLNIVTTTITKDYIESKQIRATDLIGDTIIGKTIQSNKNISDTDQPTWMIDNDGAGYLASNNINWDKDGHLNVASSNFNINGKDIYIVEEEIPDAMKPENLYLTGEINKCQDISWTDMVDSGTFDSRGPYYHNDTPMTFEIGLYGGSYYENDSNIGYVNVGAKLTPVLQFRFTGCLKGDNVFGGVGSGSSYISDSYEILRSGDFCPYYRLLKYDKGEYVEVQRTFITPEWSHFLKYDLSLEKGDMEIDSTMDGPPVFTRYRVNKTDIYINEKGLYKVELVFPKHSVRLYDRTGGHGDDWYDGGMEGSFVDYKLTIDRNITNFTQISPNGLISKSDNCTLFMNNLGIELTSMSNTDTNKFYGIKITPSGLQVCNGNDVWKKWDV